MQLDDMFEILRDERGPAPEAGVIWEEAMRRRASRLRPGSVALAGAIALIVGIGAGLSSPGTTAAQTSLVPLAQSPTAILLGS